jgi:hypothetical protein
MSAWTIAVSAAVIAIGVLGAMAGVNKALLGGAGWLAGMLASDIVQTVGEDMALNGFLRIGVGIAQGVGGVAMLLMLRWGWWTAVIGTGILFANRALGLLTGGLDAWDLLGAAGLVIPGVILALLLWGRVRRHYT